LIGKVHLFIQKKTNIAIDLTVEY